MTLIVPANDTRPVQLSVTFPVLSLDADEVGWRAWDWLPFNDIDATGLSVFAVSTTQQHHRQFSQELRIASDSTGPLNYVAGLYYFHQKLPSRVLTVYGDDAPGFALPPAVPAAFSNAALNGFGFTGVSKVLTDSYAGFGRADWRISDGLTLTAGLRYTHERKTGTFAQTQTAGIDLSTLPAQLAAAAQGIRNNFGPAGAYSARTTMTACPASSRFPGSQRKACWPTPPMRVETNRADLT